MTTPLARLVRAHKALAHPVRLRLLAMLRSGPLCVCQMTMVVGLAASTVSEHLAELREAELLSERRVGRWVEYRLTSCAVQSLETSCAALDDAAEIHADAVRVQEVRTIPLDERLEVGAAR